MLYKSSSALQIIRRITNFSTLYKLFEVVQILQRCKKKLFYVYKPFNSVLQIIQPCTNNSKLCKSFNVVQVFQRSTNHSRQYKSLNEIHMNQRSTNHSTSYKSFNAAQIIIERCTNLSKSFSRSPYYLRFCHIAILKFDTSHLYGNIIKAF